MPKSKPNGRTQNQKKFRVQTKTAAAKAPTVAVIAAQRRPRVTTAQKQQKRPAHGLFSALGGLAGSAVAPMLGFPSSVGSVAGSALGSTLAQAIGFGDYQVKANSIVSGEAVPSFRANGDGTRICHREFIMNVTGSVAFTNTVLNLNPGIAQTFPWLSTIANSYEMYRLNGLILEYVPTSASIGNATNAALGTVVLATVYDVADPPFSNKQTMEAYEFAVSGMPMARIDHAVECDPKQRVLPNMYIRSDTATGANNPQMFDYGLFQVATEGQQSAYTLGELWVTYDVTLLRPKLTQFATAPLFSFNVPAATAANPLGTSLLSGFIPSTSGTGFNNCNYYGGPIFLGGSANPNTTFSLPRTGSYQIDFIWNGATGIAAIPVFTPGSNIVLTSPSARPFLAFAQYVAAGTYAQALFMFRVLNAGTGAANDVVVSGLTGMTSCVLYVFVRPFPSNY